MAHREGLANGLMLWILAAILPTVATFFEQVYRLAVAMVVVAFRVLVTRARRKWINKGR